MALVLPREMRPVTGEQLARLKTFHAAIRAVMDESGLQDKSIAIEADIDPAQLSKIASGQAGIQPVSLLRLCRVCGSYLPLFWLLWDAGFDPLSMRERETELERQLREKDQESARLREENRIMRELLGGK